MLSKNIGEAPQATTTVLELDKIGLVNSIVTLTDDYDSATDQMIARISDAAPVVTTDEARANQERASESIAALKNEQKPELGPYEGILAKCYIPGNDVHWVNESGALDHVSTETSLTGNALVARQMIYKMGGGLVVVIYEKGYVAYGSDGKEIK